MLDTWLDYTFSYPSLSGVLAITAKTVVIYLFLVVGLRLLGRRELGQMSIFDLILIVVIANAVQNALVGQDTSLGGGIVSALVLLLMNRLFAEIAQRSSPVRHLLVGEPLLIVRDGRLLRSNMKKEGVTRDHVEAAMREHGIADLDEVQMGVLEVDGTITIVPKGATTRRTRRGARGLRV